MYDSDLEKPELDQVEREYETAINNAIMRGHNELAFELSIGLKQYQEMYKIN